MEKFFVVLILINAMYCQNIIFPFKTIDLPDKNNYILSLLYNQIYTTIEMGEPKQKVDVAITMDTISFTIGNQVLNSNNFYDYNKSNTYQNISKRYIFDDTIKGDQSNDTFYFKNSASSQSITYKNFSFLYLTDNSTKKSKNFYLNGEIGLQLSKSYYAEMNIFQSLYKSKIINKNIWSLYYINDTDGILNIGEYIFDKNISRRTNALALDTKLYWDLLFTDIKFGDQKINEQRTAEYAPQLGVIIGSKEYLNKIESYFLNEKKCQKKEISFNDKDYLYFECNKNTNVDDFKELSFIHQELNYIFTLNKNDLFVDYGNSKYFLVIFLNSTAKNVWSFGKPFIKKYNFTFEPDNKIMLFYDKNDESNKKKIDVYAIFGWVVIVLLVIAIIIVGVFIGKKLLCKPRRKKADELIDQDNQDDNCDIINN